ncbi:AAA family ATPase [Pseudoalteromonas sp. Cnat2-41]|uniref:AAA family ATPase n=1 Tax=unclassified Pseudoalteromonas TaxID=194690 RepID=UPI001EF99B98|nr:MULTISPECIES: AAA family ATPase [unclassified Pseudoalteromonas]MCF2862199.1 AAA family ATPase [Pseudoalteromonas sp. CNAT2-18]MCG7558032.1 AAA family ATPase [Pseudoalteromonas sp. CNAT2-18.1]
MRLASFTIGSERDGIRQQFKNLKNVTIDFEEEEWITLVIGWNGTGKSNVLEALAVLFRDLIMGKNERGEKDKPTFSYILRYFCHEKEIEIDADPEREKEAYKISYRDLGEVKSEESAQADLLSVLTGKKELAEITFNKFKKRQDDFLPNYVFGYYSGHSDRMQSVFRPYLQQYDKKLRNAKSEDPGLRRLFYALPVHSQFVLLAFVLRQDDLVRHFLDTQLGLETDENAESIDSVLLELNEPSWNLNKSKTPKGEHNACQAKPDIFWGAEGVVRKFLDRVHKVSSAPIKLKRKDESTLWNSKTREYLYMFIKDLKKLDELVGSQEPRKFFRDLESTYVSELISEVRIRVKLKKNDGSVTFRELSEGEQQLLTVLGLLRFTAEEESLFLLDEPDTHLNPKWSVNYIDYLNKFVTSGSKGENNSHIVLTTHNPIAIAELTRDQVQILSRDNETRIIESHKPHYDPQGMGYAGIITSDMFGLGSSLDKRTQRRLEKYRALASIEDKSKFEELRLQVISEWLENDRFTMTQRDDDYERYIKIRNALLKERSGSESIKELVDYALSLSQQERDQVAAEAIKTLLDEDE